MLVIRLQRTGKKNHASFRIVVAEKTAHVTKKFKEVLGNYDPHTKELKIKNPERLQYWLDQNLVPSPTLNNLLVEKGLAKRDKVKAFNIPKKEVPAAEAAPAETPKATESEATNEVPAEKPEENTENPQA